MLRKLIIGIIIIVALAVVLLRGDQFFELVETMRTGALLPLVFAVVSQLGKYVAQAFAYKAAFNTVDEQRRARDTLPLVFGSFFMNTIAPSFNMAGAGLVVDDSRRRGIPIGKSTSAALLMQMSIESGFLVIMLVGFIVLRVTGHFDPLWLLMLLFVVFLVGGMTGIMVVGRKNPDLVIKVLSPIERLLNNLSRRFRKGKEMKPWVRTLVQSFSEAAGTIGHNPRKAVMVFVFSVLASACELVCFCLVGWAFGLGTLTALVGGYVIATLFAMIAITPQGVGVVEVATVAILAAYGISAATATAVVLVYRGLVFWMPFTIGAILIHRTESFAKKDGKTE
ncbi:MAG TPA: TIGR00374 family protein [Coriobacteriia bacterium]|nr:TIGR00374 family protein [Coriobacteriia bacterium]